MSLRPRPISSASVATGHIAHAAFPIGNPFVRLRGESDTIFTDEALAPAKRNDLYILFRARSQAVCQAGQVAVQADSKVRCPRSSRCSFRSSVDAPAIRSGLSPFG